MSKDGQPTDPLKTSGWIDQMLDMYKDGYSDVEVIKELNMPKWRFEELMTIPEFREVVETGRLYSEAYWTKMGRVGAAAKGTVDAAIWKHNMDNRFGWADKSDTRAATVTVDNLSVDQMKQLVAQALPKLINDPEIGKALLEQSKQPEVTKANE